MNQFEKKLLETGSLELVSSYVEVHKEVLSQEFKDTLIAKTQNILQSIGFPVANLSQIAIEDAIFQMDVKEFLDRYTYHYPKCLLDQCRKNNINTARDLYNAGRPTVIRMKNIGKKTLTIVIDAFDEAGIKNF